MGAELGTDALAGVAARTVDFSFAALKELMVSAVTGWIGEGQERPLAGIVDDQVVALREQLVSMKDARPTTYVPPLGE